MAYTIRNSAGNDAAAAANNIPVTVTGVVAGDLVLVYIKHEGAVSPITVSDGTTTLTPRTKASHANGDLFGQWFYLLASVASGSVTYTASFNAGADTRVFRAAIAFVFQPTTTAAYDTEAQATGTGTAVSSGNFATAGLDEVVAGGYGNYGGGAPTAGSTDINGVDGTPAAPGLSGVNGYAYAWYRILSATFAAGAATATIASEAWTCNAIAIKTTAAAADTGEWMTRQTAQRGPRDFNISY